MQVRHAPDCLQFLKFEILTIVCAPTVIIQYLYLLALVNDDAKFFLDNVIVLSASMLANFLKPTMGLLFL